MRVEKSFPDHKIFNKMKKLVSWFLFFLGLSLMGLAEVIYLVKVHACRRVFALLAVIWLSVLDFQTWLPTRKSNTSVSFKHVYSM